MIQLLYLRPRIKQEERQIHMHVLLLVISVDLGKAQRSFQVLLGGSHANVCCVYCWTTMMRLLLGDHVSLLAEDTLTQGTRLRRGHAHEGDTLTEATRLRQGYAQRRDTVRLGTQSGARR